VDAIYCIGDSYTEPIGAPDYSYPVELAALSSKTATNSGVSGETATEIAARYAALPAKTRWEYPVMWDQPTMGYTESGDRVISTIVSAYRSFVEATRREDGIAVVVMPANRCLNSYSAGTKALYVSYYAAIKAALEAEFVGDEAAYLVDMNDWLTNPRRIAGTDGTDDTDLTDGLIMESFRRVGNLTHMGEAGSEWSAYPIWHNLNRQIGSDYALADDCFACWRMDEYSQGGGGGDNVTTILDSVGTRDFTVENAAAITSAAGIFGVCHDYNAAAAGRAVQSIDASWDWSGDWSLSVWAAPTADGDTLLDRFASGGFILRTNATNVIQLVAGPSATTIQGSYTPGAWHHIYAHYDATAKTINLEINGSAATPVSCTNFAWGSASEIQLCSRLSNSSPYDGKIQQLGFWSRKLTTAEKTVLYNGGSGQRIPGL